MCGDTNLTLKLAPLPVRLERPNQIFRFILEHSGKSVGWLHILNNGFI